MLANSFKGRDQYLTNILEFPSPLTTENYIAAFAGKDFVRWFVNSAVLTLASTFITMVIALLAGYAFAKMSFKGRNILFRAIVPLMSIPPVAMIIPQFQMIAVFGMVNTLSSVIFIYCGLMLPMTIYLFRNFIISVPDSLLEAARIDGCYSLRILIHIIIPLCKPAIITSSLVNIVWVWNELLIALVFLQKESLRTLVVGITLFKSRYSLNVPVIMAGLVLVTLPMVILYVFGQRRLVDGLLAGSIKE
jgi:ABC-type glycerol-3-phosphate transport system permease component